MNRTETGTRAARVLGAALRTWATLDGHDGTPVVARLQVRQPPAWEYIGTVDITARQCARVLDFLRGDLAEYRPGHSSPERAAAVIDAILTELAAAGRTHITAADLVDAAPRIGRPYAWIAAHIADLVDAGQLLETRRPDRFRIA
jgi:hypothetical protein